jgi:hypothetical protein
MLKNRFGKSVVGMMVIIVLIIVAVVSMINFQVDAKGSKQSFSKSENTHYFNTQNTDQVSVLSKRNNVSIGMGELRRFEGQSSLQHSVDLNVIHRNVGMGDLRLFDWLQNN